MLDVKLLRENPDAIRRSLQRRNLTQKISLVAEARESDEQWRMLKAEAEELRHRQNELTIEVVKLKAAGRPIESKVKEAKEVPQRIREMEEKAAKLQSRFNEIMMSLPNLLDGSVPDGKEEGDNPVVRSSGKPRRFGFTPKPHIDLLNALGMVDMERAAKISGARTFFLKGDMVKLEQSIMRYAIDLMSERGFQPVEPPLMMSKAAYDGVVDTASFGPVIYKIEGEDLHLIATSEHPLVAMHMDEILDGTQLPIKYCGFSPCFRVEAGAHGKDTKGIFRTHQFYKVEQVVFCKPEESWKLHEELIGNASEVFQNLGLPFRVVLLCGGETGSTSAKTYDIEAWLPSQEEFREMVSASNVTDYQARSLKIRYRERQNEPTKFIHTLNSTVVTTRALVAIVENYQESDGSITIPSVLVPYMDGLEKISGSLNSTASGSRH